MMMNDVPLPPATTTQERLLVLSSDCYCLKLNQQLNEHDDHIVESHLSSSSPIIHKKSCNPSSSSSSSISFFAPKLVSSSSYQHQHQQNHHQYPHESQSPSFSCCFNNVLSSSKRWHTLIKFCSSNTTIPNVSSSSMATQLEDLSSPHHSHHPAHSEIKKKKLTGQQKREELEREVSMLQNLLDQEEKVHEILEMVHNRPNGAAISIPDFLPPKMKELLGELMVVEGEIARLESQISQLQGGLSKDEEKGVAKNKESSSKSVTWNINNNNNVSNTSSISNGSARNNIPIPSPIHKSHERMAFETKALHFISKAIKGDYHLNDFSLNDKAGFLKNILPAEHKENNSLHNNNNVEDVKIQERLVPPRKSGILKPSSSPFRDPRHPSPKPRERNLEMYIDVPTKSLLDPLLSEENDLKWQPNKLSESIMKCLNFIYVRLLRTSRAMELEKSGPISRSIHHSSSLSSRSFRVDPASGLNPKSSLILQRESSRQQDPYGIFDTEESIPRDIGPYKNLVIFTSASMDSKFISSPSSIPLLRKLRVLMSNLQTADLKGLTYQQKLAFWINMYNACIMHGFIQYGVPSTPEKLLGLMNKATLNVGGNTINAQAIEHFILRKRTASNIKEIHRKGEWEEKESVVRELYGLESMDPNVSFALCCGTRSSPAVRIYTGDGVISELERSKLDYLQASIMVTNNKKIAFPELLLRNMLDFAMDTDSLVEWVCNQLPTKGTLRKSMVDCFRGHPNNNVKASTIVDKIPYDYEFQYLLTI